LSHGERSIPSTAEKRAFVGVNGIERHAGKFHTVEPDSNL
jgi:hypothetical protein